MKRRSLLKSLTAASLGAPLIGCSNLNSTEKSSLTNIKHNPIGVSTYSFWQFNGRETPIEYCIDKASEFGFDGIELLLIQMESEENSYLQKLKKRAFDSGLDIMGLSTHQSFVSPDPAKRKENIELTKHQIEVAYSLGIPTIRIKTGRWGTTKPLGDKSEFDVLMDNKKVAGILLESGGSSKTSDPLRIGIGVNLVSVPTQLLEENKREILPISLQDLSINISAEDFLVYLAANFAYWETELVKSGFSEIRKTWLSRAHKLGELITVRTPSQTCKGIFEIIDESGNLVLKAEDGSRIISAGDIYFGEV